MRNINRNKPINLQPGLSFWDQLQNDVDKISDRAKQKLEKYQKKKYELNHNNPQNKTTIKLNIGRPNQPTINTMTNIKLLNNKVQNKNRSLQNIPNNMKRRQIIELVKNQNQRRLQMRNRLAYLKQNKQRQHKTIQIARKKFQHIISVRTQSFKDKQEIRKKINSFQNQNKNYKSGIVNAVRQSKQKRNMSLQSYKSQVSQRANSIRAQTINNQSYLNVQKMKSIQQNALKARRTKQQINKSRSVVYQVKQKKYQSAKNYRDHQLTDKVKMLNQQKKNNQLIFNKLRFQADKINRWKSKAQRQIQQYKSYLGLTTRNSDNKSSSKVSEKPFYITSHY